MRKVVGLRKISESKTGRSRFREQLNHVLLKFPVSCCIVDFMNDYRVIVANEIFCFMMDCNYESISCEKGIRLTSFFEEHDSRGLELTVSEGMRNGEERFEYEISLTTLKGKRKKVHIYCNYCSEISGCGIMVFNDITSSTYQGSPTGLPDRNAYTDYVNSLNTKSLKSLGIIVWDINGLKNFNKKYGNGYGDRVVMRMADVLRSHAGMFHLFHIGSDEFYAVAEDCSRDFLQEKYDEIKTYVDENCEFDVSAGVAWKEGNPPFYSLLDIAVTRHSADKINGYNKRVAVNPNVITEKLRHLEKDIEENRFTVYLQPKVCCRTEKIISAEALIRKYDRDYGFLSPARFIPALEEDGLIKFVDFYMFEEVYKILQRWQEEKRPLIPVSVNFSRVTLMDQEFFENMQKIRDNYSSIPPSMVEIEITESVGEISLDTMRVLSQDIKNLGFRLSLDDFGSSYTNMSTLMVMDFDELKIDKTLISASSKSDNGFVILAGIASLGKKLGVKIVAEGVETSTQREEVRALGFEMIQGYYYSKPLPVDVFEEKYMNI